MTSSDAAAPASGRPTAARGTKAETAAQTRRLAWCVAAGLCVFAAVWLLQLARTSLSPPVDDIEQLTWVRSLEWGYFKHPPLPTWLIWLPVQIFGLSSTTVYAMGAAVTLGALALYWRLLLRLRGPVYATVALLAALCITYYNGRLHFYNHNVVLMLLSTACAALTWQAFTTRHLRWWLALGLAIGLGALAKYQIAVTIACVLVFAAQQRAWRDPQHRLGLWLAALVALLVFTPHVYWLRDHDFGPVRYAITTSLGASAGMVARVAGALHWVADQLFNRGLVAGLLLAAAARSAARSRVAGPARRSESLAALSLPALPLPAPSLPARSLLLAWGVTPLLFMPLLGLLVGADLPLHWGSPFLLFAVPAAMELTPRRRWHAVDLQVAAIVFVGLQVLLLVASQLTSALGPEPLRDHNWAAFDAKDLADIAGPPARLALQGPIRIIIANPPVGGALALQLPERPLVLMDGRFDQSPWVTPELLQRCGALQVGGAASMAGGQRFGPAFGGLSWRVIPPVPGALACPASPP